MPQYHSPLLQAQHSPIFDVALQNLLLRWLVVLLLQLNLEEGVELFREFLYVLSHLLFDLPHCLVMFH